MVNVSIEPEVPASDGRRRRTDASRSRIVQAMLALTRAGDMRPSAARVAKKAGVGLRSVFRHFEDVDSLYSEMSQIVSAKILPMLAKPLEARDWRGRLFEIAERRMTIYDEILPFKTSGSLKRFESRFLMDAYKRHLKMERDALEAVLPAPILNDNALVCAIDLAISFQAWQRLRQDRGLPTDEARKVTRLMLTRLCGNDRKARAIPSRT
jgi:AcrR family transcriptional regulator